MTAKITKAETTKLLALRDELEKARDNMRIALEELHGEWEAEYELRSEKWQEGEAGVAAQERIEAASEMAEEIESIDLPDLSLLGAEV